MIKIMYYKK